MQEKKSEKVNQMKKTNSLYKFWQIVLRNHNDRIDRNLCTIKAAQRVSGKTLEFNQIGVKKV